MKAEKIYDEKKIKPFPNFRCVWCGKLVFTGKWAGEIVIKCPRCRKFSEIKACNT